MVTFLKIRNRQTFFQRVPISILTGKGQLLPKGHWQHLCSPLSNLHSSCCWIWRSVCLSSVGRKHLLIQHILGDTAFIPLRGWPARLFPICLPEGDTSLFLPNSLFPHHIALKANTSWMSLVPINGKLTQLQNHSHVNKDWFYPLGYRLFLNFSFLPLDPLKTSIWQTTLFLLIPI